MLSFFNIFFHEFWKFLAITSSNTSSAQFFFFSSCCFWILITSKLDSSILPLSYLCIISFKFPQPQATISLCSVYGLRCQTIILIVSVPPSVFSSSIFSASNIMWACAGPCILAFSAFPLFYLTAKLYLFPCWIWSKRKLLAPSPVEQIWFVLMLKPRTIWYSLLLTWDRRLLSLPFPRSSGSLSGS